MHVPGRVGGQTKTKRRVCLVAGVSLNPQTHQDKAKCPHFTGFIGVLVLTLSHDQYHTHTHTHTWSGQTCMGLLAASLRHEQNLLKEQSGGLLGHAGALSHIFIKNQAPWAEPPRLPEGRLTSVFR